MAIVVQAVLLGMLVMVTGIVPRLLFAANLRSYADLPWGVPLTALFLWILWRYLRGDGSPRSTAQFRRESLRAKPLRPTVWAWSILAGGLGLVALVIGLRVANRLVVLPQQPVPDLPPAPTVTLVSLLLAASLVAGVVEEAAFRGYMQGPIEKRYGIVTAILVTGTMFAVAHFDFTPILWPYYVAVAAIYGLVTYLTGSILPAVVLHTAGNVYSNFDLWLHGQGEWQMSATASPLVWDTGVDQAFWLQLAGFLVASVAATLAYLKLARAARLASAEVVLTASA